MQYPGMNPMDETQVISALHLNRISIYLRCLNRLQEEDVKRVSSKVLADRFHLSAPLIRKDLAHFGEFGIRGHGYDVEQLIDRLKSLLGLDRKQPIVVVGMGKLGSALVGYLERDPGSFRVVAGLDSDRLKIGSTAGNLTIRSIGDIGEVIDETGAQIALLTVPPEAAQATFDLVIEAGIRSVLNFAPVRLEDHPTVTVRNVDLRIYLEELAFRNHSNH